jgi:glyoxylase-like metal-dependent hydrolase (beta-lactamase superfamily II)
MKTLILGPFEANCYILEINKNLTIIIDPGSPDAVLSAALESLQTEGICVLLTHRHLDHCLGAGLVKDYCDKIKIPFTLAIHEDDSDAVGQNSGLSHLKDIRALGLPSDMGFLGNYGSLPEATRILHDADIIHGMTVIHTPGHSRGSICFYKENDRVLFSGDTLFAGSVGRADLPGGHEQALLVAIRQKLMCLPDDTVVYPGHGPMTSIGRERKYNPFLNG